MIRTETIDRVARVAFYFGMTVLLAFNTWLQTAPISGTDPVWWDPGMAYAATVGIFSLTLSVALGLLGLFIYPYWNRKPGNRQTEASR